MTASTYRTTTSKAGICEYLVAEMKGQASAVPWPILVDKVISVYDENEDEVLDTVIGYDGYTQVTVPINENATWKKKGTSWDGGSTSIIKPGMVVSFVTNSRGHATSVDLIYDPNNREDYYSTGDFNAMMNEVGIAEDASSDVLVMKIGTEGRSIAVKASAAEILVCDDGREISKGSFLDARLYTDSYDKTNPRTYSDVVVFQYQRWPRRVYIFNH